MFSIYVSNATLAIDVLLISDGEKKHYCWMKNFDRLLSGRTETTHRSKHHCRRCLLGFKTAKKLEHHDAYCAQNDSQKIVMPEEGSTRKFEHFYKKMRVPFVINAYFEAF